MKNQTDTIEENNGRNTNHADRLFRLKIIKCVREMLKLAVPVVVARTGSIGMNLVDTIMVGRFSTQALAYQSMANTIAVFCLVIGAGLIQGTIVVTANAFGQGKRQECGAILRRSLPYAFMIGVGMMLICLPSRFLMNLLGQPEDVASGGADVLSVYALGLPFAMLFAVMASFMEGTKRPIPGMTLILIANLLNIFLNWVFVYGQFGFPAMGAIGSAISTSLIQLFLAIGIFILVFCIDENDEFGVWIKPASNALENKKRQEIGYGSAITMGVEEGSFSAINVMAGWLGILSLGAFSIILSLTNIVFMMAGGIGTACAVMVGIAKGRQSAVDVRIVGIVGICLNLGLMFFCGFLMLFFPELLIGIYTTDPTLIALSIPIVMFCSLMCLFDGTQVVLVNILRGAMDIFVPTVGQAMAFLGIMIPLVWILSFKFNQGIMGMAYGMVIANVFAVIFLGFRFYYLCRKYAKEGF